jgi:hypothetical protein
MADLTDQQIYERLGKIKGLPTCSQWASGFSESIREQIKNGRTLSDRQKVVCYKILKENNEEAQQSLANWESEYNMHHKKAAIQIATYYKSQAGGYFGDVVKDILNNKIPPRDKFLKMRNNKYAKKVLVEIERKPRFGPEDHIIPNSKFLTGYSFKYSMMQSTDDNVRAASDESINFKRRGGIIIGVDDKICSAVKGSKRYIVLPFGSMKTYYVEERYLKIKPKVKKAKK